MRIPLRWLIAIALTWPFKSRLIFTSASGNFLHAKKETGYKDPSGIKEMSKGQVTYYTPKKEKHCNRL